MKYWMILLSAVLVNNFVMNQYLGICPFLGVSRKLETAAGMGVAVTFVMGLASVISWLVYTLILVPLNMMYMQTIAFILTIAALVQFVEMFIQKSSPALYSALGVYLPLITTNCAVLGAALQNITRNYNLLESLLYGVGGGLGFLLVIMLFAGIRERLEGSDIAPCFRGLPIALITAGLMSVAFMGFSGMIR